jgi:hypothetical protein
MTQGTWRNAPFVVEWKTSSEAMVAIYGVHLQWQRRLGEYYNYSSPRRQEAAGFVIVWCDCRDNFNLAVTKYLLYCVGRHSIVYIHTDNIA